MKQPRVFVQVSIVSQEPVLFADSIMHNIAYGMPGGSSSVSLAMVRSSATPSCLLLTASCVGVDRLPRSIDAVEALLWVLGTNKRGCSADVRLVLLPC